MSAETLIRPAIASALRVTVVEDPAALAAHTADWDALVDRTSLPFCASRWLLAWWTHARPERARLAVVLVHGADDSLVGLAPFFLHQTRPGVWRWRPLAAATCQRVEPMALPGCEVEVANAIAGALAAHTPRPDVLDFEGIAAASSWPALLAGAWPGRVSTRATGAATALMLDLSQTDFDGWFMSKSAHFRQRLRKQRKAARTQGGAFRLADSQTAIRDIESFLRVHVDRWAARGGTGAVTPEVAAVLRAAGPDLVASGRLRIWSLDVSGVTIASSLVFRAGRESGYWLNGFAKEHARLEPSKISILQVIEDAFAVGAGRLDLGEGVYEYKRRFANGEEALKYLALVPPAGRRRLLVEASLAPGSIRRVAARRLSPETRRSVRRLLSAIERYGPYRRGRHWRNGPEGP